MSNTLRKVIYRLGNSEFWPDATEEDQEEMAELSKERRGFFHRWAEDVDTSKDIPCIKPMALVEDAETGEIHFVEPFKIRFTIDWL